MEDILTKILVDVVISLLGLASAYVIYFIKQATNRVKAETEKTNNEGQKILIENATTRVSDLAEKTVTRIESTIASKLRESVKDGKIDREELVALGKQATDEVYNQLSEETKELLEIEIFDIKKYIEDAVEKAVFDIKKK